jgi:predicted DNA-binding transcriptional regulator AlpA
MSDRLLTLPEVAEVTRLSLSTHRWLRQEGRGPKTFKVGRRVVAKESDVLQWIDRQHQADTRVGGAV